MKHPLISIILVSLLAGAMTACSKHSESESHNDEHAGEAAHGDQHQDEHVGGHADEHADEQGDAHEGEAGHAEEGHGDHEESEVARIDAEKAAKHGIEVATASGGAVPESIDLTGRLIIDPRRIALVRARFAGPVRKVAKEVGDSVRQGEALAQVESNDSLTVYDVTSPISGVVLERMTNVGDVAGTEPLYRIGDLSNLQAELKVFQNQQDRVHRGADAIVRIGERELRGKVLNIVPEIDSRTQAALVRVSLEAKGPVSAAPGQFVSGSILVDARAAEVAVPADAVQRFEGREVVFVPTGEGFRARPVEVGRRTLDLVEITEGLEPGESYVAAGAFLVKAEIGKGAAGHDH
jgi:cobalt-zinc-cadmium efflux system membrane fusion protein